MSKQSSALKVIGFAVAGWDNGIVKTFGLEELEAAQTFAAESTKDCKDMGINWGYRVTAITELEGI